MTKIEDAIEYIESIKFNEGDAVGMGMAAWRHLNQNTAAIRRVCEPSINFGINLLVEVNGRFLAFFPEEGLGDWEVSPKFGSMSE